MARPFKIQGFGEIMFLITAITASRDRDEVFFRRSAGWGRQGVHYSGVVVQY